MPAVKNLGAVVRQGDKIRRPPQAMMADKAEIARLLLEGNTLKEISIKMQKARAYKISFKSVEKQMLQMRKEWILSAAVNMKEVQARELAKIDNLERTFWEAWYESWNEVRKEFQELVEGWREKKVARVEKETMLGKVEYLQGVEWCITQRCKIFGLEAPTRTEIDWRVEAKKAGIEDEQAAKQFEDMVNDFARKLDTGDGAGRPEGSEEEG